MKKIRYESADKNHQSHFHDPSKLPIVYHYDLVCTINNAKGLGSYINWHKEVEILYLTEGKGYVYSNNHPYPVKAGDIVLLPPYTIHYVENITNECRFHCIIVQEDFVSALASKNYKQSIYVTNNPQCRATIENIIEEIKTTDKYSKSIIEGELTALAAKMWRHNYVPSISNSINSEKFSSIIICVRYMHEHLAEEITLIDLCNLAKMSRSRFSEYFHQYIGMPFKTYLNKIRCDHAHMLLTSTDISISECAEKCGFQNHSYFVRQFRSFYNLSPSELRQTTRNIESVKKERS